MKQNKIRWLKTTSALVFCSAYGAFIVLLNWYRCCLYCHFQTCFISNRSNISHFVRLIIFLQCIINFPIDGMGWHHVTSRLGHLWWSRTLAQNIVKPHSSRCNKLRAGRLRRFCELAWAGVRLIRDDQTEFKIFNHIATTWSFFTDMWIILWWNTRYFCLEYIDLPDWMQFSLLEQRGTCFTC